MDRRTLGTRVGRMTTSMVSWRQWAGDNNLCIYPWVCMPIWFSEWSCMGYDIRL